MKIKKIKIMMPVMAFVGMLLCIGCCSDDDEKGISVWSSEGCQSAKYAMVEVCGRGFIEVSAEDGIYTGNHDLRNNNGYFYMENS